MVTPRRFKYKFQNALHPGNSLSELNVSRDVPPFVKGHDIPDPIPAKVINCLSLETVSDQQINYVDADNPVSSVTAVTERSVGGPLPGRQKWITRRPAYVKK